MAVQEQGRELTVQPTPASVAYVITPLPRTFSLTHQRTGNQSMPYSLCCLLKATRSHHGLSTRASVDYGDQQMTDFETRRLGYTPPTINFESMLPQHSHPLHWPHQLHSLIIAFRGFLEDAIQARVSMSHTHTPTVSELREFLSESWCSDASKTTQRAAHSSFLPMSL
jgi:hypothetical protein